MQKDSRLNIANEGKVPYGKISVEQYERKMEEYEKEIVRLKKEVELKDKLINLLEEKIKKTNK